jgi:hypothetical protein
MRFAKSSVELKGLLENSKQAAEIRKELFSDETLKKRLEFLVDYFDRKGFLE